MHPLFNVINFIFVKKPPPEAKKKAMNKRNVILISTIGAGSIAFLLYNRNIVLMGKKYKGTPYKWGGSAPGGFDCSGFIYYLYKKYKNKTIPRTAMTQFLAAKEIKTPKRGNLLFFSNPGCNYITHVGIYAGNNKMLHASSSNGIELTDLSNNYWQNRYVSAGAL